MRLIDADKLKERAYQMRFDTRITDGGLALINYLLSEEPTVDHVKHGRWMGTVCSACGESFSEYYDCNYCPNCGARMDGETNETD